MSSLLSAISGKFSTNLILGTFFPVTVFVFLARVLWVPLLPAGFHPALLAPLAGLDDKWELLILTLVTIVLSGLLFNLNIPVIRFYEGYPWKDSWLGQCRTDHHRAALRALLAQQEGLYPLRQELLEEGQARRAVDPQDPQIPRLRSWIKAARVQEYAVRREVFAHYPPESLALPTRLGNVIRSFESYPERQYGMAAITLWPRLIAVLDSSYAEVIDSAKAGVDFMLNSSVLAGLLSLLLLATGLVTAVPLASRGAAAGWLFAVALLTALSWWLYVQSIGGALDWGNLVRSAFDLYRGKLIEKLGYGHPPKTAAEERELWQAISSRLVAGDPPPDVGEIPPYERTPPPPTSCACGSGATLGIARGVVPLPGGAGLRVVVEVRNPGTIPHAPVVGLVVSDTVPEGFDYQWGSASASAGEVKVEGTNPYRFSPGEPLAPGDALQLSYRIVPRSPSERGRR